MGGVKFGGSALIITDSTNHDTFTLRALIESNFQVVLQCSKCGAKQGLDLNNLIALHGAETRLGYVRRQSPCENCGAVTA